VVFGDRKSVVESKVSNAFTKLYQPLLDEGWKVFEAKIYMNNYIKDAEYLMTLGKWFN
jgi:hypothetical protein